jgi:23S rRNA A2030 N6-methylase RlmJ
LLILGIDTNMNYRHHFHAGNFADVMKHVLLLQLLTRLNAKDKPYRYIDTHGGAGKYDLSEAPAQKSGNTSQAFIVWCNCLQFRNVKHPKLCSSI